MKTMRVLFSICCLMLYNVSSAQTIFTEQYNTSTCSIAGLGGPGNILCTNLTSVTYPFSLPITGPYDVLEYDALRGDQEMRFQKNIGTTLNQNDAWAASFDFQIKPLNAGQHNYAAVLFALNDETDHFRERNPIQSPPYPSGVPSSDPNSNASSISVWLGDELSTGQNDVYIFIRGKINGNWIAASNKLYLTSFNANQSTPNNYNITVERQSKAVFVLKVEDLSNGNIQELCYDATGKDANNNDVYINGLEYLQQGTSSTASSSRTFNGYIDNLIIEQRVTNACLTCAKCEIENELSADLGPDQCTYEFNWVAGVGNLNHFAGSVLNYGDGLFDETRNLTHSTTKRYNMPPAIYNPTLTSFSYYYNNGFHCCKAVDDLNIDNEGPCNGTTEIEISRINPQCEFQPNMTVSISGKTVTFTNTSSPGTSQLYTHGYLTSALDFGDCEYEPDFEIGQSVTHTYPSYATYYATITCFGYRPGIGNEMDCCRRDYQVRITLQEYELNRKKFSSEEVFQFDVYPNPFKNEFKVSLEEGVTEIRVHNYVGKEIRRVSTTGQTMLDLDFCNEATGIYIISAIKGEEVLTKKIIKQ